MLKLSSNQAKPFVKSMFSANTWAMEVPLSLIAGVLLIGGMFSSVAALADSDYNSAQVDVLNQVVQEKLSIQLAEDYHSWQAERMAQYEYLLTEAMSHQSASRHKARRVQL